MALAVVWKSLVGRGEKPLPHLPDRQRRVDITDGCVYMLQHRTRYFTAGLLEETLGLAKLGIGGGLRLATFAADFIRGMMNVGCGLHPNMGFPHMSSQG